MEEIIQEIPNGYGIIPKAVMRDKEISVEAKALYSYISSYIGNNKGVTLDIDLACKELGFTEKELNEYEKELLAKDLIESIQT